MIGIKGGKPGPYDDHELFRRRVTAYFEACKNSDHLPTWPGLAYYLGYSSRHILNELMNRTTSEDEQVLASQQIKARILQRAKLRLEALRLESGLRNQTNPKICEFDLKNNFGYADTVVDVRWPEALEEAEAARTAGEVAGFFNLPEDEQAPEDWNPETVDI